MQIYSSSLSISDSPGTAANVVPVGATLEQVVDRIDLNGPGYVLVVHEDGAPAGVISTEELLLRISAADDMERLKWSKRPIESILTAVFAPGDELPDSALDRPGFGTPWQCTSFVHRGRLQALATDDDMLLSWRSLESFLACAARDSVTGLVTRAAFLRSFECELARARRSQKPVSLLLIDVDFFKQVNDVAGHAAGDAVLSLIAGAICASVRSYDLVARFAGDEFVALCCECVPDQVYLPINRIQDAVQAIPLPESFPVPRVTLSIGAAAVPVVTSGITCETLLEAADECLYTAKRQGRDRAFAIRMGNGPGSEPALVPRHLVIPPSAGGPSARSEHEGSLLVERRGRGDESSRPVPVRVP